jgi:hypothetical protein
MVRSSYHAGRRPAPTRGSRRRRARARARTPGVPAVDGLEVRGARALREGAHQGRCEAPTLRVRRWQVGDQVLAAGRAVACECTIHQPDARAGAAGEAATPRRPGEHGAVGLSRVHGGQLQHLGARARGTLTQSAQALGRARPRKLDPAQVLHEVAAPHPPGRLHGVQHRVDAAEAAWHLLGGQALAQQHAVPQQEPRDAGLGALGVRGLGITLEVGREQQRPAPLAAWRGLPAASWAACRPATNEATADGPTPTT